MSSVNPRLVSIIMPSYNSQYISESIESIIAQSYKEWELLITDDCSTDNTCQVVESYVAQDSRIKLFRLAENQGAAVARNKSIEQAQGRYLAFCDSDDSWMPSKLELQLSFMEQHNAQVCYSSYIERDEQNNNLSLVVAPKRCSYSATIRCDQMGFLTFIYDTKRLGKIEMPLLRKRQDWALKLKVMERVGSAIGIKEPLAYYRISKGSLSSGKFGLVSYNIDVYRKVLNYSPLKAWMVFLILFMPSYIAKQLFAKKRDFS